MTINVNYIFLISGATLSKIVYPERKGKKDFFPLKNFDFSVVKFFFPKKRYTRTNKISYNLKSLQQI